jgi:SAM-dependent methyltransferase
MRKASGTSGSIECVRCPRWTIDPAVPWPFVTATDHRPQTRHGYDTVAEDYARLLPGLNAETTLDIAMIDDFADRCVAVSLGPVLDAGCGTGRVSAHLAARGLEVFGIDLSPGMVKLARRTYPQLRFNVGALENLPVSDAALGGLLAWYCLIHTAPHGLSTIVSEFARVLKPGAWLLAAFQAGDGQCVKRTSAYGHSVALTNYRHNAQHLVAVLSEAGFDIDAQLHRSAEGGESTSQCVLLARRRG